MNNTFWHRPLVHKEHRNQLYGHRSCVLWFTGLSGAGKSTIAMETDNCLFQKGIHTYLLDGDNIRQGLNSDLGFSQEDRQENIRRIGHVSRLFADAGLIALAAFITPYRAHRDMLRSLFDKDEFIEVYVQCPLEECERRDPKGLYKKARSGQIHDFTGVSAPYEIPANPELIIESDKQSIQQSVQQIIEYLTKKGYLDGQISRQEAEGFD